MAEERPLLAVLQVPWQHDYMLKRQAAGPVMAHIDATGQTNSYGYALYAVIYKVGHLPPRKVDAESRSVHLVL